MEFDFTNPQYLYFLFVIPFMIFYYFYSIKKESGRALRFANFQAIARIKGIDLYSRNIFLFLFDIIIVVIVVFSIAGFNIYVDKISPSSTYLLAIDSSESMGAQDILPNRFDVAKSTAINFVNYLPQDSFAGIVSFSTNTYIEKGLTSNKEELKQSIDNTKLTSFGGTDIYEVISIASMILKEEKSKVLIILSDGQVNTGDFNRAIYNAMNEHIVIYTIGIGTSQGGKTEFGISKLDEKSLKTISNETRGEYFSAGNGNDLDSSFRSIVQLSNKSVKMSLAIYLLIAAILLFLVREFLVYTEKISI